MVPGRVPQTGGDSDSREPAGECTARACREDRVPHGGACLQLSEKAFNEAREVPRWHSSWTTTGLFLGPTGTLQPAQMHRKR